MTSIDVGSLLKSLQRFSFLEIGSISSCLGMTSAFRHCMAQAWPGADMPQKRAAAKQPRRFSDELIEKLPRAAKGKRYGVSDRMVPGLRVRVTDKGHKAFLIWKRLEGRQFWTTRYLGKFPGMSVDEARTKARAWLALIEQGRDPAIEIKREVRARLDRATFEQAALDFIAQKLPTERRRKEVTHIIMATLIPLWGHMPLVEVSRRDVVELIRGKKLEGKPGTARILLVLCKRMFTWFVGQEVYALDASPCSEIKATALLGEVISKGRELTEDELKALWIATSEEAYPVQQIYRMLMLNGLRLREVVDASVPEFSFANRDWIIPRERMKAKEHKAKEHLVPLTAASLDILGQMPNFEGPFLFSLTCGKTAVTMPQRVKSRIDERMLKALRQMAVARGEDPAMVELVRWVNHDIRRTMRSHLSRLRDKRGHKFPLEVREAVLAHTPPAIVGIYDKHDFAQEKFECLEAWAARLDEIVNDKPAVGQIIEIAARRA
ncbi:MAG: integrase family protein [Alphaproteobacteria bacterium]|nr:integrase family protein [Alphaproteobacteria bacterium]